MGGWAALPSKDFLGRPEFSHSAASQASQPRRLPHFGFGVLGLWECLAWAYLGHGCESDRLRGLESAEASEA